jgi:hypothetical protein
MLSRLANPRQPATVSGTITSPWRVVMIGADLNTLVNCDVIHNLCPPPDPKLFPEGIEIPEMFIGKNVIHLPTVKTHGHSVTTGAIKNAFGGLLKEVRHYAHKYIHEVLVDLMMMQKELHPGVFSVMDGTVCGDGAGPRTMEPVYWSRCSSTRAIRSFSCFSSSWRMASRPGTDWRRPR